MEIHTPSPWVVRDFTVGVEKRLARIEIHGPTTSGRGFHPVCTIPSGFTNQRGDATLISASPDLLAACREALRMVDEAYEATGFFRVAATSEQRMRIEAAIAKATEPRP